MFHLGKTEFVDLLSETVTVLPGMAKPLLIFLIFVI